MVSGTVSLSRGWDARYGRAHGNSTARRSGRRAFKDQARPPTGASTPTWCARRGRTSVFSGCAPHSVTSLVLEGLWRVVPRLSAIDLEAATHLGIAVDADDLVALRALPALEAVRRALERHAGAALVAHLALQGRSAGTCVAREVSAHVVSLLLPPSPGGHHQHGPTLAILHPPIGNFRMPIPSRVVLLSDVRGRSTEFCVPLLHKITPGARRRSGRPGSDHGDYGTGALGGPW